LHRERIDLARVVRQTTDDLQGTMAAAELTLEVEAPDVPVWVEADPMRLAQVAGNLLNNAAKFTDPGGKTLARRGPV
jgi:signal transduction histidine kinase